MANQNGNQLQRRQNFANDFTNDLAPAAPPGQGANVEIASTRAAQEVQAAMVIAQRFPRNTQAAYTAIMESCRRKTLAMQAIYSYPRGGTQVEGPSIRLAEVLAQNWRNLDFGVVELEQRENESICMSYCWDLETNVRQTKVFTVPHVRHTKKGVYRLTDPRDIYEMVANQGARRLRACILGIIPGDIVDAAVEQVNKTLENDAGGEPLKDRIRKMADAFYSQFNVSVEALERRLGHNLDATSAAEIVSLQKIYVSLRDGMSKPADWFPPEPPPQGNKPGSAAENLASRLGNITPPQDAAPAPQPPSQASNAERVRDTSPAAQTQQEPPAGEDDNDTGPYETWNREKLVIEATKRGLAFPAKARTTTLIKMLYDSDGSPEQPDEMPEEMAQTAESPEPAEMPARPSPADRFDRLTEKLASRYNADYQIAQQRLIDFCTKLWKTRPDDLTGKQLSDLDLHIERGDITL